jgi:phosphoserine phosphatase
MVTIASDLEGTLSSGEMWREIGRHLKAGVDRARYQRYLVGRMPAFALAKIGLTDSQSFKNDWFVRLATFFAGWDRARLDVMASKVADTLWRLRKQSVVDELIAASFDGARIVIVSGGYLAIVEAFAVRLRAAGARDVTAVATPLAEASGRYTGALAGVVCTGAEKVARLRALLGGAPLACAYGDTYADIPMLALAERAVAVDPDSGLHAQAKLRGWRVVTSPAVAPD